MGSKKRAPSRAFVLKKNKKAKKGKSKTTNKPGKKAHAKKVKADKAKKKASTSTEIETKRIDPELPGTDKVPAVMLDEEEFDDGDEIESINDKPIGNGTEEGDEEEFF